MDEGIKIEGDSDCSMARDKDGNIIDNTEIAFAWLDEGEKEMENSECFTEGKIKRGGVNKKPTTPKPEINVKPQISRPQLLENKDENLIEGKNRVLAPNPWPGVASPPTFKEDPELKFWKDTVCELIESSEYGYEYFIETMFDEEEQEMVLEEFKKWRKKNGG